MKAVLWRLRWLFLVLTGACVFLSVILPIWLLAVLWVIGAVVLVLRARREDRS